MDIQTLTNLFATTYDPNPNARKAGELEIRKVGSQEGMVTAVMHIIGNDSVEIATRQAASVYLKNRVHKSYAVEPPRQRPDQIPIPQSDRDALKSSIFPLIVSSPSKSISVQLASTLRTLISHDFPEKWPNLMDTIKTLLASNNVHEVTAGCTAILEVIKVYRYRQGSETLEKVVNETFPQLVNIGLQLLATPPSGPSQDVPTILHFILKTYRGSIILQLSKHQQGHDSIVPWGRLLFQIVNLQVPNEGVPENEDDREKCEWWKAKKWAYSVLGRLFHRYGNPSQLPSTLKKDYLAFAEHFVSNFAPEIFKTYLRQVELLVQGQQWLSKKAQYHIFSFFTECVKPKSTWAFLKPHFQTLVSSFVFPQLCFTSIKQELWETDPVDYVRTAIDEYEDFAAPVSAATSFLFSLASARTKTTFMPILQFINSVLESNAAPSQKFGALNMTAALGPFMMRHPQVRPNVEQFVVQHVFPEFNSSLAYMRSVAVEVIGTIEKNDMYWSNEANLVTASRAVAAALDDPELPVRVQAALSLTEMVTSHDSVEAAVRPQVGKVIQDLLKLSDETDLDILNSSMETMVEKFHAELLPVAGQLTARLCDSYLRLMRENLAQEVTATDEQDALESNIGDDDKTFAAMGVAKTISTIVASVDTAQDILAQVEEIVIPVITFTLENKAIDLFDNMYDLVDALTFNLRRISPAMWTVFELTYKLFKSDAIDFLEEMLPSLDNFISYGSDVIKQRPDYKMMILDIYTTAMKSDHLGEADRVNACKLIESFLLNLRGTVDDALPAVIELSLEQLDKETFIRALRVANLESIINAILYNPSAALHIMENTKPGAARKVFDKWFAALKSPTGLPRVHDMKLSILTMCALLEMEPSAIPASLQDGWSAIVSAVIHVLQKLPQAIEKRKALEDAYDEAEESEDEIDEGQPLNLEDDDDDDVWDEDSEYIEMLAKEGERLREKANSAVDVNGDDEAEESDDEEVDEELGFISPLDTVDPYSTFKNALTAFQMKNPAMYQAATTSLNIEQQTALMEIMAIAEKNASSSSAS
ncbi:ARM repeat-containing protein [Fomitiporia mediterranea MF3/22]|uniref:ARM repeat-containing protein n=1 Tax=Fomitiporia mediterranea (strain MF3/22) TaxID=694068 RepID=UPI00044087AE|nr:ARM repeat-containing protein [Fomitiporia mediterranea MF3/22]EJC98943.1 ARM repeat-containing protein [Fomitiporia mediterranea MF3/22]